VFQISSKKLIEANGNKEIPLILWTSRMTGKDYLNRFLDPKKHIIQVWLSTKNRGIADIVESGFKTIFTNWNTLYLDCGFGSWVGEVSKINIYSCIQGESQNLYEMLIISLFLLKTFFPSR